MAGDAAACRRMGYVPQEDFLHPQLGLRRTLEYAAKLRLPSTLGAAERARRVDAALAELDLTLALSGHTEIAQLGPDCLADVNP